MPWKISSATRLVAPITLDGSTALSLEISTHRSTPWWPAACATRIEPTMLFFTASQTFSSISGTCLCAAA